MLEAPIAICYALKSELREFRQLISLQSTRRQKGFSIARGSLGQKKILLVRTGMGRVAARAAMMYLLEQEKPRLIISTGFAGALLEGQESGALVLADRVINQATGQGFFLSPDLVQKAQAVLEGRSEGAFSQAYRRGTFLTTAQAVSSFEGKSALAKIEEVVAVEMETAVLVGMAEEKGIPCLAIRAIFDPLRMTLPEPNQFLTSDLRLSLGKLFCLLIRRPTLMARVPQFMRMTRQASLSLAHFLEGFVRIV